MTCTNPECVQKRRAVVANMMYHVELFWHYARVLPEKDRHRFASLFSQGITKIGNGVESEEALAGAVDILVANGVEMIIRSKTQEIKFEPRYANTSSSD